MKILWHKFLGLIFLILCISCAHSVHQVHAGDFYPYTQDNNVVSSHAKQFTVLGFADNTNYVEEALEKLLKSCRNGKILGVTTEHTTNLGFFSWTNNIYMKGSCVKR